MRPKTCNALGSIASHRTIILSGVVEAAFVLAYGTIETFLQRSGRKVLMTIQGSDEYAQKVTIRNLL